VTKMYGLMSFNDVSSFNKVPTKSSRWDGMWNHRVSRVPSDLSALRLCVLKKRARLNPARAAARLTYERSRKTTDAWLARMYNTVLTVAPY
jgi:hypothetical protein